MRRDAASERQVQASDPFGSSWVTANAGSGKTKVLIDRVARLLLSGVGPQHILCLTYTKAAAAEMQNRLFQRLGDWAMKPDDALVDALRALGHDDALSKTTLDDARRLFARAIETPGGLRIQTIHAFCATLLRRFPLEAGVTPRFTELDDRAAELLREEIVDELAEGAARAEVEALARVYSGEAFETILDQITRNAATFARPLSRADCHAALGIPANETGARILGDVFLGGEAAMIAAILPHLDRGSSNDLKAAAKLGSIRLADPDLTSLIALEDVLLSKGSAKEPYAAKIGSFPTKATRSALGPLLDPLEALMGRVAAARGRRIALAAADSTMALHGFAVAFLPVYEARKAARGSLDFDDLIVRTHALLTNSAVAQWVLFRLDGGIDHILVDEAQDTSPAQWKVIERLAAEFTVGQSARDQLRTIFVVGDKKQSIYSFQGADVAAFDRMKADFAGRLGAVGQALTGLDLEHSFRSAQAILALVDATFGPGRDAALGGPMHHIAHWGDMPGRVELWPPFVRGDKPEESDWHDPVDLIEDENHVARLGRAVAGRIREMIDQGTAVPTRLGPRPCHAGDFLILVQRRSPVFSEIIRACKAAGLPIAGADRLKLGAELAVKDIAALLAFLATPEDDLSLATVLRSPLCGWTEGQLYDLAHGRDGYLWGSLRGRDLPAVAMLADLRDQADYLRPYDLIERVLTRHDGRRRLIGRLGTEAEDGIDELLSQALAYERGNVPSLTGFLAWLQTDDIEVKRQMDSAGDRIRVMTVHGAKGLEAPIVILPDTAERPKRDRSTFLPVAGGPAMWKSRAEEAPPAIAAEIAARDARQAAENLRLLYVAMTRAQSWLMVAAAGDTKSADCWFNIIRQGMQHLGATETDGALHFYSGDWPAPGAPSRPAPFAPALPEWAGRHAVEPQRARPMLSPSDLGGAKALAGEGGLDEATAKRRGAALHLLLEHLPATPRAAWADLAASVIDDAVLRAPLLEEATRILDAPALAAMFAPGTLAEVSVTAALNGQRLLGTIDRLILEDDRVLAIDFKSNRVVPDRPEAVPEGILRQMGAYQAALAQIYPSRQIDVAVLWTATATLMPLSRDIVSAAVGRTTIT